MKMEMGNVSKTQPPNKRADNNRREPMGLQMQRENPQPVASLVQASYIEIWTAIKKKSKSKMKLQ